MLEQTSTNREYISVKAGGKFHKSVPVGTPGAVLREGVLKDGSSFSKTELLYNAVSGKISSVGIYEGKFGTSLNLIITEGEKEVVASFSTLDKFGEDMMHKVLNIDMNKIVRIVPYSMEVDGKTRSGVTVYQDEKKITSAFKVYDEISGRTTSVSGFPEFPVAVGTKKPSKEDYQIYNMQARKFMLEKINERFSSTVDTTSDVVSVRTSGINLSEWNESQPDF